MTFALDLTTLTVELTAVDLTSTIFTMTQIPTNPSLQSILIKYRVKGSGPWISQSVTVPISLNDVITLTGLTQETEYEAYSIAMDNTLDLSDIDEFFLFKTLSSSQPPLRPVSDRILKNVVATLKGITKGTQYFNEFEDVTRIQVGEYEGTMLPYAIVYTPDSDEHESAQNLTQSVVQHTIIEVHYRAHEGTDEEGDEYLHDIKKALMQDDQRGGLAINTEVIASSRFHQSTSQERGLLLVVVDIFYRHSRLDPAEVRC